MGHSSLVGVQRARATAAGHDTATLGPGDSSDSGSDMAGLDDLDTADPTEPVDVAMRDDNPRASLQADSMGGFGSDSSGTGERRSAAADGGLREAADISVDRIFTPGDGSDPLDDDEDPDLAFVDEAEAGDVLEDESLSADDDGESDAEKLADRDSGAGSRP